MTFPSKTALEALWDGEIGDDLIIKTSTSGAADSYGEKAKTYSAGTAARGRMKIIKANETLGELGQLVPGDGIALLKLAATIGQNDRVVHNSITYEVIGIVQKKTHLEAACKRMV